MKLVDVLREIQRSSGMVTVADLARRLRSTPEEVRPMLVALQAAGRLGPGRAGSRPVEGPCPAAGSCSGACPGPADCPWAAGFAPGLELRARRSG